MFVSCVSAGRSLCKGPITYPGESCRMCVSFCDQVQHNNTLLFQRHISTLKTELNLILYLAKMSSAQTSARRSLLSKCHVVSRHTRERHHLCPKENFGLPCAYFHKTHKIPKGIRRRRREPNFTPTGQKTRKSRGDVNSHNQLKEAICSRLTTV